MTKYENSYHLPSTYVIFWDMLLLYRKYKAKEVVILLQEFIEFSTYKYIQVTVVAIILYLSFEVTSVICEENYSNRTLTFNQSECSTTNEVRYRNWKFRHMMTLNDTWWHWGSRVMHLISIICIIWSVPDVQWVQALHHITLDPQQILEVQDGLSTRGTWREALEKTVTSVNTGQSITKMTLKIYPV